MSTAFFTLRRLKRSHQLVEWQSIKVMQELGHGAFGAVFLARHNHIEIAIKSLGPTSEIDENSIREVNALRDVVHPNVIQFLGLSNGKQRSRQSAEGKESCVWLLMEYADEGDLLSIISHKEKIMDCSYTLRIAHEVALGLLCIHEQHDMAHLDLKSPNILIHAGVAKVGDFGMAMHRTEKMARLSRSKRDNVMALQQIPRPRDDSDSSSAGSSMPASNCEPSVQALGTPEWMAPEMFSSGERKKSVDTWSFAVILWELITRKRPYQGFEAYKHVGRDQAIQLVPMWSAMGQRLCVPEPDGRIPAHIRADYDQVMTQCWHADPAARPKMRTIVESLEDLLSRARVLKSSALVGSRVERGSAELEGRLVSAPPAGHRATWSGGSLTASSSAFSGGGADSDGSDKKWWTG